MIRCKRKLLIVALSACQLFCLAFGVVWATGWLHGAFGHLTRRHCDAVGRALALDVSRQLADQRIDTVEPGTLGWKNAQSIFRSAKVPNDGFISIVRADTGALVCHSGLETDPALLGRFPGRSFMSTPEQTAALIEFPGVNGDENQQPVSGAMEFDGQLFAVTAYRLNRLNAILTVSQSEAKIDAAVALLIRPVVQTGLVMTMFVVGVTGVFTVFLLNSYEHKMAGADADIETQVEERTHSLLRSRNAVVFGLSKLVEARDKFAVQHLDRIRSYVTILSSELAKNHPDITHQFVADLAVACSLHDIGKVGVPDEILLKPGRLTNPERRAMQLHTSLGGECLESIQRELGEDDFLQLSQQIAMYHHEHWDGSGYPNGLKGKEIPLAARIVALADVYDALTTVRPYKGAASHEVATEWLSGRYGTQFDPDVVDAFMRREHDFQRVHVECATTHCVEGDCGPNDLRVGAQPSVSAPAITPLATISGDVVPAPQS